MPLRDVTMLRALAAVLNLPPEVFGLAPGDTTGVPTASERRSGHRVGPLTASTREEDDPVRRRMVLLAAGLAGTSMAWRPAVTALTDEVDPAAL